MMLARLINKQKSFVFDVNVNVLLVAVANSLKFLHLGYFKQVSLAKEFMCTITITTH